MKVEQVGENFMVSRGENYFCFFVDDTRSCWTKKRWQAAAFNEVGAHEAFVEIQRREKLKREQRKERING